MKAAGIRISLIVIALGLAQCFTGQSSAHAQGRIVINEYMPWPANACGSTADFIELLNMGPGPMNIGGYIVTDGDYAITIPMATTLQPGQFYVLSGQSSLPQPCGNIAQNVTVNLNWNTCNCTSGTIPTTGDGLLTDGGSANEQVVLLNSSGAIVDAVARNLPVETSSTITTKSGLGFPTVTFNLDLMSISYETIGQSAGRGNSFARRIDGACGWLKDTQQSAGATNNTPGDVADLSFDILPTINFDCLTGNARITLTTTPAASYLPMDYILGFDANADGLFTLADTYSTGTSSSAVFTITNLPIGNYSINIQPVQGCNSQTLPFVLPSCSVLDYMLSGLTAWKAGNGFKLTADLSSSEEVAHITLEGGNGGRRFVAIDTLAFQPNKPFQQTLSYTGQDRTYDSYRLLITDKNDKGRYSEVVTLSPSLMPANDRVVVYPNPVEETLHIEFSAPALESSMLTMTSASGMVVKTIRFNANQGSNQLNLSVAGLPSGPYFFRILGLTTGHRADGRLIKQ